MNNCFYASVLLVMLYLLLRHAWSFSVVMMDLSLWLSGSSDYWYKAKQTVGSSAPSHCRHQPQWNYWLLTLFSVDYYIQLRQSTSANNLLLGKTTAEHLDSLPKGVFELKPVLASCLPCSIILTMLFNVTELYPVFLQNIISWSVCFNDLQGCFQRSPITIFCCFFNSKTLSRKSYILCI